MRVQAKGYVPLSAASYVFVIQMYNIYVSAWEGFFQTRLQTELTRLRRRGWWAIHGAGHHMLHELDRRSPQRWPSCGQRVAENGLELENRRKVRV